VQLLARVLEGWSWLRRRHGLTLVAIGLLAYFAWHAVNGSRGLLAWQQYNQELAAAQAEIERLRAERAALEHKVARLRASALDPDLLDELARRTLSLAHPLDVIILLEPEAPPEP
jgi:cell division protein FtsB